MQCPRCLNEDPRYFYNGSKGIYCRRCIQYGRILLKEDYKEPYYTGKELDAEYQLKFQLTEKQKQISDALKELCFKEDVLVYAACGAGKTEIVFECIRRTLEKGMKVCWAIPRRQVVIEIGQRLAKAFSSLKVITVCGGMTEVIDGDLIVCTTHQLYRYPKTFDLLILDEPDAFPYKGNPVLQGIVRSACKGHLVALSATPDASLQSFKTLTLFSRPHGYPLAEPKIVYLPSFMHLFYLQYWCRKHQNVMLFVPTIQIANHLSRVLGYPAFTSVTKNKEELIQKFREHKFNVLICTTVLERGVTFSNVQVLVLQADHNVFDRASLIQIAGRVGRDPKYPKGEVVLLCGKRDLEVDYCQKEIRRMNASIA